MAQTTADVTSMEDQGYLYGDILIGTGPAGQTAQGANQPFTENAPAESGLCMRWHGGFLFLIA